MKNKNIRQKGYVLVVHTFFPSLYYEPQLLTLKSLHRGNHSTSQSEPIISPIPIKKFNLRELRKEKEIKTSKAKKKKTN